MPLLCCCNFYLQLYVLFSDNSPPKFIGMPSTLPMMLGKTFRLTLQASDPDGSTVSYVVQTNLTNYTLGMEGFYYSFAIYGNMT